MSERKNENQNLSFAEKSVKELFFGLLWLAGVFFLRYFENLPIADNIKFGLTAMCFIALASKGFKGFEFVIKSWQQKEPNTLTKYLGTVGNSLIALFFIIAVLRAVLN